MSIQSVSSNSPLWQVIRNDLKALIQDLTTYQASQKAGCQDQIQTVQDALEQTMTSLLNDITNSQSSSGASTGAANIGLSPYTWGRMPSAEELAAMNQPGGYMSPLLNTSFTTWDTGGNLITQEFNALIDPETGLTADQALQAQGYPAGMDFPAIAGTPPAQYYDPAGMGYDRNTSQLLNSRYDGASSVNLTV